MASTQVMRRQEQLEAGKRKLEEFRKKKAAEKAKKAAASTNQNLVPDGGLSVNQPSQTENVRLTDSDGAAPSTGVGGTLLEQSAVELNNDIKATEVAQKSYSSSYDASDSPFSANNYYSNFSVPAVSQLNDKETKRDDSSESVQPMYGNDNSQKEKENDLFFGRFSSEISTEQTNSLSVPSIHESDSASSRSSYYGLEKAPSLNTDNHVNNSLVSVTNLSPQSSAVDQLQGSDGYADRHSTSLTALPYGDSVLGSASDRESTRRGELEYPSSVVPDNEGWKSSSFIAPSATENNSSPWPSDSKYTGFSFDYRSSPPHVEFPLPIAGTSNRRSRPSFLDSINVSRVPSGSTPITGSAKVDPFGSKVHPVDTLGLSDSQNSMNSFVGTGNGPDSIKHSVSVNLERNYDFNSRKRDEDFSALEQHIEDLTQEKFSLQRALEASRALAESLAAENSGLTDSYNQQGSIVHQLKSDMEKLQEEIKAHLVELEAVKIEYTNAQLECNAADERAKLLASEVITLEEKALRLRSNELKLERQLENSQAEISSFKKKMSSLEKEHQDLQLTIYALQEEKKLLQSKLRKTSGSGKFVDASKSSTRKKDVSTSTEDIGADDDAATTEASNMESSSATSVDYDSSSLSHTQQTTQSGLEGLSSTIPPDQIRMIQNINTLISELALEKDELTQALSAELSQTSKLKELNMDLTRKLEVQTQRLELLTAQSMANDNILVRQPDSRIMQDNTVYADEGDEVVERVLGWIMKLFPGGPSRRRSSKRLTL